MSRNKYTIKCAIYLGSFEAGKTPGLAVSKHKY